MRKFLARALDLPALDPSQHNAYMQQFHAAQQAQGQQPYGYNPAQPYGSQPNFGALQQGYYPPPPQGTLMYNPPASTNSASPAQHYQVDHSSPIPYAPGVPRGVPHGAPPPTRPTIARGENYGLTLLSDPGEYGCADIIFVHGLNGNAYNTWFHEKAQTHWPSSVLPNDLQDCRLFTFGYDANIVNFFAPASRARLNNHAENLVGSIARYREHTPSKERAIIFVCHSLGGLVVQAALDHSRNRYERHIRQIERSTIAIAFLGTPHHGSDQAKWGLLSARIANVVRPANRDIIGVLRPDSEMLALVQNNFHTILRLRREERREIEITCFWEELPMEGVGQIVPEHSAKIPGYSCYPLHANHMNMTKFPSASDPGYQSIRGELLRWRNDASAEMRSRPQATIPSNGAPSAPTALGMRDSDVRAIFDSCRALRPMLHNQYCGLKQLVNKITDFDKVIGSALSHHRETAMLAGQSEVSQHANSVLTFRTLSDQMLSYGTVGFSAPQITALWNSMYEAIEQRLEQVRDLRRALGHGADNQSIDSIFGGLVVDDFLIDVMGRRM